MSRPFKLTLVALAVLLGAAGLTLLHLENRRLQRRLDAHAAHTVDAGRLWEDNTRLERLIAEQRGNADLAHARVRRDIEEVRAEIALREKTAEQQHATQAATTSRETALLESSRDPRFGLTRLEHFQNRGQATPSAALETLVWAALKGDEATLASLTTLNSATRAKAEAFIAQLPAEDRAKWTPEKLGQLWFSGLFTEMSAVEIVGEAITSPNEAMVRLRLPNRSEEEKLALRLTPNGWRVLAPGAAVDHLRKKLAQ